MLKTYLKEKGVIEGWKMVKKRTDEIDSNCHI